MTLDEAILHAREVAERNRRAMSFEPEDNIDDDIKVNFLNCATKHEQFAEWLERLKVYESDDFTDDLLNMGFTKGYNRAIDDFVKYIDECSGWTQNCIEHDISLTVYTLHQIAEQLKEGVEE